MLAACAIVCLSGPLVCPVSGSPVDAAAMMADRNGVRHWFCSEACREAFKKEPLSTLKAARAKGWTVGVGVFDPISGRRLTPSTSRGGWSEFEGVKFAFANPENKSTFDTDPKRFGLIPEKWAPNCPIMGIELAHTYGASGYVDQDGVRFFACCDQCWPKMRSAKLSSTGVSPKVFHVPAIWAKLSGPGWPPG